MSNAHVRLLLCDQDDDRENSDSRIPALVSLFLVIWDLPELSQTLLRSLYNMAVVEYQSWTTSSCRDLSQFLRTKVGRTHDIFETGYTVVIYSSTVLAVTATKVPLI